MVEVLDDVDVAELELVATTEVVLLSVELVEAALVGVLIEVVARAVFRSTGKKLAALRPLIEPRP